jgi:hypothetical protein
MPYDVFLSHSSKDKAVVDVICEWLEREGIRCWIAPRDIRPGANWGSSIVHAIRESPVMVLVFSNNANMSPQIKREVERAVHVNSMVIPVRIENIMPDDDLEYFLGMPHWLDAFNPPLEKHLPLLVRAVKEALPTAARKPAAKPPPLPTRELFTPPPVPVSPAPAPATKPPAGLTPVTDRPIYEEPTLQGTGPQEPFLPRSIDASESFTASLAESGTKLVVTIAEAFYQAGTPGKLLRLVPVQNKGDAVALELYLKTGDEFTLGRSPEADLITAFFPRSEKNDSRSRRLSKIHARIVFREGRLCLLGKTGASLSVGADSLGTDGRHLRERDKLVLADDYALAVYHDISLENTLVFTNADKWRDGIIEFRPTILGALRFQLLNSEPAIRQSCWLFTDVGIGSAPGGVLSADSHLAPEQGLLLTFSGCFWLLNLVANEKAAVNDLRLAEREIAPLSQGDSVWLGAVRYRVEIS